MSSKNINNNSNTGNLNLFSPKNDVSDISKLSPYDISHATNPFNIQKKSYDSTNNIETVSLASSTQNSNISKYSNTEYSDLSNIRVHQLKEVMVEVQNMLTIGKYDKKNKLVIPGDPHYYEIFCKYCEGMTIGELLDCNGNIIFDDEKLKKVMDELKLLYNDDTSLFKTEQNSGFDGSFRSLYGSNMYLADLDVYSLSKLKKDMNNLIKSTKLDSQEYIDYFKELRDCKIEKIVASDSGYDATVLKDKNNNYMVINSSTNGKSVKDLAAIAYAMSIQLTGTDSFTSETLRLILKSGINEADINMQLKSSHMLDDFGNLDKNSVKKYYEQQLKDNKELITELTKKAEAEGSSVQLYGYSLGGGIQLTAYSSLLEEHPELDQYISSVTTYNPYISFCEENPKNTDNKLIKNLVDSDKVLIYSASEDYVSTFNNCLDLLHEKMLFLDTKPIDSDKVVDDDKKNNLVTLYNLVIGNIGNHGFTHLDMNSFDENGNIKELGEYVNVSKSFSSIVDDDNNIKNSYKIDYKTLIDNILDFSELDIKDKNAKKIYDSLTKYLEENVGNYDYNEVAAILTNNFWKIVESETSNWGENIVVDISSWDLVGAINEFFLDDEVKATVMEMGYYLATKDNEGYNLQLDYLYKKFEEYLTSYDYLSSTSLILIFDGVVSDKILKKIKTTINDLKKPIKQPKKTIYSDFISIQGFNDKSRNQNLKKPF